MITSKEIIQIHEKYFGRVNSYGVADVFINPDSSDYKELYRTTQDHRVRFLADNLTKKVYVADAYKTIHNDIAKSTDFYNRFYHGFDSNLIAGYAVLSGGKFTMNTSNNLDFINMATSPKYKKYIKELVSKDWSWLQPYINCRSYLDKLKSATER